MASAASKSRSWLITGASSGLGAALALEILSGGARVVGATRNIDKARQAVPEFEKQGGAWLKLDVTSSDCEAIVRATVESHDIDVLVNCAGYALLGALEDISDTEIAAQMDANLTGPIRCIRGALPIFRARGNDSSKNSSVIVNYSSGAALIGVPGRSLYCASKAALESMTEALAKEVEPFGIRVIMVVPGAFKTPFSDTCVVAERGKDGGVSEAYRGTPAEKMVNFTRNMAAEGALKGDPVKAAKRLVEVVERSGMAEGVDQKIPFRLFVGTDCTKAVEMKLDSLKSNYEAVGAIAKSTDLD